MSNTFGIFVSFILITAQANAQLTTILYPVGGNISNAFTIPTPRILETRIAKTLSTEEKNTPKSSSNATILQLIDPTKSPKKTPSDVNLLTEGPPTNKPALTKDTAKTTDSVLIQDTTVTTEPAPVTDGIEWETTQKIEETTLPIGAIPTQGVSVTQPHPTSNVVAHTDVSTEPSIPSENCLTPIGKRGLCIRLAECTSLYNLLTKKHLLVEDKLYLKKSQCGFKNQTVMVCCPDNVTPPAAPINKNSTKAALLPKPGVCGRMNTNRLYGGFNTEIDAYGWSALLQYAKDGKSNGFYCGATLINDRYILTAAHCVTGLPEKWSLTHARLGEWDTLTDIDCEKYSDYEDCADSHIDVPVEQIISHPDYMPTSRNQLHDIALIRLSSKINYTDFVYPVCLPDSADNLHGFDEQSLDLVGWGVTPTSFWNNKKQRVSAPVISLTDCRNIYADHNIQLKHSQFCIEGRLVNETCRVDSGGAAVSFDTAHKGLGNFYIAGIQSFGLSSCSEELRPGVYTRVGEYLHWILENIRE